MHTLGELREVSSLDEVVGFQEYFAQAGLPDWVVFQVKLIKTLEGVLMCVHVERVDR